MPAVTQASVLQWTLVESIGTWLTPWLNMNRCHALRAYLSHLLLKIAVVLLAVLYVRLLIAQGTTNTEACIGWNVDSRSLLLSLRIPAPIRTLQHALSTGL